MPLHQVLLLCSEAVYPPQARDAFGYVMVAKALDVTPDNAASVFASFSNTGGAFWGSSNREFDLVCDMLGWPRNCLSEEIRKSVV